MYKTDKLAFKNNSIIIYLTTTLAKFKDILEVFYLFDKLGGAMVKVLDLLLIFFRSSI